MASPTTFADRAALPYEMHAPGPRQTFTMFPLGDSGPRRRRATPRSSRGVLLVRMASPVLEIECIPKLVIIVSDCIPGFRSVCPMCIPTFSSFIVLRAQFPSPSFPCGSSPDTMKQLSLKPHLTAPSAKDDDSSSGSGSPAPFFMVCMYHMCIPGF